VNKTIEQIKRRRSRAAGYQPRRAVRAGAVIPVLEHLALNWAPKPPLRNTARRRINSPLKLVSRHELRSTSVLSGRAC
jgi:hypothetical protein